MRSVFPGFPHQGIDFMRSLARHNQRDWFQPRKPIFDQHVKAPMMELVAALNGALATFAPDYVTEPAQAIYRIYRDTRFSNDKTPYKEHIAASFPRRGMPRHGEGGYYFSVSAKEIEVGGGVYLPQPPTLAAIRRQIAGKYEELRRILAARDVRRLYGEMQGGQLTRVPKGFACDHPAADLLRFKSFILFTSLPAELATSPRLYTELVKYFKAMAPFIDYLTAPLAKAAPERPKAKGGQFDDRSLPVTF